MIKEDFNDVSVINTIDGVKYISFKQLEQFGWLKAGFSTKVGGVSSGCYESLNLGFERGDLEENVWTNLSRLGSAVGFETVSIAFPNQWHTNNIRVVDDETICGLKPDKSGTQIDGQITGSANKVLFTYGADCTPIYVIDDEHHAIGLSHSGWKGTANSICEDMIKLMKEKYFTNPQKLVALIGPSISMDAYEVSEDVASIFIEKYSVNVSESSEIVKSGRVPGKYQLDLWAANKRNLIDSGLKEENIYISGLCTYFNKELMYSHRRDGNERGVMAAFMYIK